MQEKEIRNIIAKYLAGEASPQEESDLRHWVDLSPENAAYFEEAYATWEQIALLPDAKSFDLDRAWSEIRSRAGIANATPATRVRSLSRNYLLMRVAAAVVVLAGLGWALYTWVILPGTQPELLTLRTDAEKAHFFLPDSSEVWLNAFSELKYAAGFEGETRSTNLKGEAFFSVKRNEAKPFEVVAGETRTRVLGTSFNVRAFAHEAQIDVSVASGKVAFGTTDQQVTLAAGNQATFRIEEKALETAPLAAGNAHAWQSGRLVFDNSELQAVAQDLSRYFGVEIAFEDPTLGRCHYSGSFDRPELAYVLEVIAATVNMQVDIQNKRVIFSGRGCGQQER